MSSKIQEEGVLFMRVDNPIDVRRALLESSRDVIELLRKYEKLKEVRIRKVEETARLRRIMREVSQLIGRLNSKLPNVKLKIPKTVSRPKSEVVIKPNAKSDNKAPVTLNDLDSQLKHIEDKLSNLS